MTNIIWGSIMATIGGLFTLSALISLITRHDVPIYHWLAERSRMLWKGGTHYFYLVIGAIIMTLGVLWACGVIFA